MTKELHVLHRLPGRIRVHLTGGRGQGQSDLEYQLHHIQGVERVQMNVLTGNVLIHFDPTVLDEQNLLDAVRTLHLALTGGSSQQESEHPSFPDGSIPQSLFHLAQRNRRVADVINAYALGQSLLDTCLGLVGSLLPLPGAGLVTRMASLVVQAPLFLHPMLQRVADIYTALPDELEEGHFTRATLPDDLSADDDEWTREIAQDILLSVLRRLLARTLSPRGKERAGIAALLPPLLAGGVSVLLDATRTATVTWRMGLMAAIYYQAGGWIESREETERRVQAMVPWSLLHQNLLQAIPEKNPEVQARQIEWVQMLAAQIIKEAPESGLEQVREQLVCLGLPRGTIEEALRRLEQATSFRHTQREENDKRDEMHTTHQDS